MHVYQVHSLNQECGRADTESKLKTIYERVGNVGMLPRADYLNVGESTGGSKRFPFQNVETHLFQVSCLVAFTGHYKWSEHLYELMPICCGWFWNWLTETRMTFQKVAWPECHRPISWGLVASSSCRVLLWKILIGRLVTVVKILAERVILKNEISPKKPRNPWECIELMRAWMCWLLTLWTCKASEETTWWIRNKTVEHCRHRTSKDSGT